MKLSCKIPHIQEVVMNTSFLYEGTLGVGDKLVHVGGKTGSHHLGDKFCDCMDEANRPKIDDVLDTLFLWN